MRRLLWILLLSLIVSPAFAKSLHWRTFDVTARLDADGRLHVREQQGIVFDGDWNGGERRFNVRTGQSLEVLRVVRVENGHDMPMARGDLSQVDHWDYFGSNVVRWRSRKPSDPPFQNQEITYAIEYLVSGVLQTADGGARLHHDFAFPDRDGLIESFTLRLDLDPVWRGLTNPFLLQRQNIPPGQSVIVDATLTYTGQGAPAAVVSSITTAHAGVIAALLLIAGIALTWKFYVDEKHKGRFGALLPAATINEAWLRQYVLSLPPEVVGYAWDEMSGPPEVGAVIARMEQEKKITTWTTQERSLIGTHTTLLHMRLNVERSTLPKGEQDLMEGLLLEHAQSETDTDKIRQHYSSTGFQPQMKIKPMIDAALADVPEWNQKGAAISPVEIVTFLVAIIATWIAVREAKPLGFVLMFGFIFAVIGLPAAIIARRRIDRGPWPPIFFAWGLIVVGAAGAFAATQAALSDFAAGALAAASFLIATCLLLISRSREAIPKIAFRRRLAAARNYFETQLRAANPKLHDAWYPYLIALGLGPSVDRWFRDFSRSAATAGSFGSSSSSFGSSSSSGSSWSGGGGAFGGAGASGSWAAISVLASGVASPSSGGSGGGGGGGGSGGGGGGGW